MGRSDAERAAGIGEKGVQPRGPTSTHHIGSLPGGGSKSASGVAAQTRQTDLEKLNLTSIVYDLTQENENTYNTALHKRAPN